MRRLNWGFVPALLILLSACSPQDRQETLSLPLQHDVRSQPLDAPFDTRDDDESLTDFVAHIGLTAYTDISLATQAAQELDSRIAALLHTPNEATLNDAQAAWRDAYDAYLYSLLFGYLPLSDPSDWHRQGIDLRSTLSLLDTWPIEGGYIDHIPGYPFSGIVNDLTLPMNAEALLTQHRFSDDSYASLGYHAIEFMLWGGDGDRDPRDFFAQENTAPVIMPLTPGDIGLNSINDLEEDEQAEGALLHTLGIQNHARRRQYVQLLTDQLQKHLLRLQRRWQPSNGYYADMIQNSRPQKVVQVSLWAGNQLLAQELLVQRLHGDSSAFSQTSLNDLRALLEGLQRILFPSDRTLSLHALLQDEPNLIEQWQHQWQASYLTIDQWQRAELTPSDARQQLREHVIGLMSLLQRSADHLDLQLQLND